MPELPEVETIRSQLEIALIGKVISNIILNRNDVLSGDSKNLINLKITSIRRFSKLLSVDFEKDFSLLVHLKMTGQLIYLDSKNRSNQDYLHNKHTHIVINFKDKTSLIFNDQRRFGYLKVIGSSDISKFSYIKNLGPEFLKNLDFSKFVKILNNSRTNIKSLLLNQSKLAGVGNIYASEALWLSKINPLQISSDIKDDKKEILFNNLNEILNNAIYNHGSSRQNFRDIYGKKGNMQNNFKVYERELKNCEKCGNIIKKITISGRGTYFCPFCQV